MTQPMSDTRLIERWLPIAEIGIESLRERTPMTPFPAPNRLHVWWARRPLVASRAAVLASLLPSDADHDKFKRILGIHGDPIAAKVRIAPQTELANGSERMPTDTSVRSSGRRMKATSRGSTVLVIVPRVVLFLIQRRAGAASQSRQYGLVFQRTATI